MITVHTIAGLHQQLDQWRTEGQRIAFAPTMGNLHRGHLRLMEEGRRHADRVVASIFVNPLQFGPKDDFSRYPRTLAQDQAALEGVGVDLLFAPSTDEMYPRGREHLSTVCVPQVSAELEGAFRPGHFDGVTTVVNILFNLVQPDVALFGEKDFQQLAVIRRMVADLRMRVRLVGVPTERDVDGLALSSRNQYLSTGERALAVELYRSLKLVSAQVRGAPQNLESTLEGQRNRLKSLGFIVQYLEVRNPLLQPRQSSDEDAVILVAAKLGTTRLIDNLQVFVTEI
ncbi:MAG: pantoate--beta-alanine ligase [Pseudomonadota bacterium]|nr:pantoate--beta-alanine ligase [Pseudomonadota bacterium]